MQDAAGGRTISSCLGQISADCKAAASCLTRPLIALQVSGDHVRSPDRSGDLEPPEFARSPG